MNAFKKIVAVFLTIAFTFSLTGCKFADEFWSKRNVGKIIGVDLWDTELIGKWDQTGWDGNEQFRAFSVPDDFCERLNSDWQACPLTGRALEQYNDEYLFAHPRTLEKVVPWVTNGWYLLLNEAGNSRDCRIAILDMDTNILYFYVCGGQRTPKGI